MMPRLGLGLGPGDGLELLCFNLSLSLFFKNLNPKRMLCSILVGQDQIL